MLLFELHLILIIFQVELDTTVFNNTGYNCLNAAKAQGCQFPWCLLALSHKGDVATQWGFPASIF